MSNAADTYEPSNDLREAAKNGGMSNQELADLKGKIAANRNGLEGLRNRLDSWKPGGKLNTIAGEFNSIQIALPGSSVSVQLPTNHPGIGWFRNCCLFALLLGASFKCAKILKI